MDHLTVDHLTEKHADREQVIDHKNEEVPLVERLDWIVGQVGESSILSLEEQRQCLSNGKITYAYGSPLDYTHGRLHPELAYEPERLSLMMDAFSGVFVAGHATLPGRYSRRGFEFPADIEVGKQKTAIEKRDAKFEIDTASWDNDFMLTTGSVGNHVTAKNQACFLIETSERNGKYGFEFVSVPYERDRFLEKMRRLFT